jgi:hypothetical protein
MSEIERIRERWAYVRWKATHDFDGSNWLVASLGEDHEGRKWHVTTDGVHASERVHGADDEALLIGGAPADIATLLARIGELEAGQIFESGEFGAGLRADFLAMADRLRAALRDIRDSSLIGAAAVARQDLHDGDLT